MYYNNQKHDRIAAATEVRHVAGSIVKQRTPPHLEITYADGTFAFTPGCSARPTIRSSAVLYRAPRFGCDNGLVSAGCYMAISQPG